MTLPQYRVLTLIANSPERASRIAQTADVTRPSMTGLVDGLVAKDGAEAVDKVTELAPDVVTMDFNMPRMNGAESVRAIMAKRPTPVIMSVRASTTT